MRKYKTLKDYVYNYISEEILDGKLVASQRINETAISQELSLSRTPIREALIQLSCEGILNNIPRKGFILKGITEKEASDLYMVIGILDGTAAYLSCDNLTEKDLSLMDFYIQSMNLSIKVNNYKLYLEQQNDFHQIYIDLCGNDVLIEIISRLKSRFFNRGCSLDNAAKNESYLSKINAEHSKILELFKEKNKIELFNYMIHVHWSPLNAHDELF